MLLKFKIYCTCCCEYSVSEKTTASKIICPNCGVEYPYSDKLISILNTADQIPDGNRLSDEHEIKVTTFFEDMK